MPLLGSKSTDAGAAQLAGAYSARAFTVGRDIAFGTGEGRPGHRPEAESRRGRHLRSPGETRLGRVRPHPKMTCQVTKEVGSFSREII